MTLHFLDNGTKKSPSSVFVLYGGVKKTVTEAYQLIDGVKELVYKNEPTITTHQLTSNGIFEWFMPHAVRYVGTHDRTYVGYYTSNSVVKIDAHNTDADTWNGPTTLWSSWGAGDDHSTPSVIVLQHQGNSNDGKILVGAAEHNGRMEVRRSTNVEDISTFDSAVSIASDDVSYAILCETSDGTVWLFYRRGATDKRFYFRTSSDGGASWGIETELANYGNYTYAMVCAHGNNIHTMINYADTNIDTVNGRSAYLDIRYLKYNGSTTQWEKYDGTRITLPVNSSNEPDIVYQTPRQSPQEDRTFLWDIKAYDDEPYMIVLNGTMVDETIPYDVHRFCNDNGSWVYETVCGSPIFGSYGYRCGAVLDTEDASIIYASENDTSGNAQFKKYVFVNDTWVKSNDITNNDSGDCFRPMAVNGNPASIKVFYCYTTYYEDYIEGAWESEIYYVKES